MTKDELIVLLEDTLREIPQNVDDIHATKKLFSALSSVNSERFSALEKLYDISLYTSLLSGDFAVLFHQFLSSNFLYERKFAMAKLYPLMNEGFKHLYGFVNKKTGKVDLSKDAYWKDCFSIKLLSHGGKMNVVQKCILMPKKFTGIGAPKTMKMLPYGTQCPSMKF